MKNRQYQIAVLVAFLFLSHILAGCTEIPLDDLPNSKGITKVFDLPSELSETSGIIIYDSLVWTFNDSGHSSTLYGLDMITGAIKKRIIINATNIDWEDIAQDSDYIYLGDFGNNLGSRGNLCIYVLSKDSINDLAEQTLNVERINFHYEDQVDFSEQLEANAFDCEALFSLGDSLYIFTKNWQADLSTLYRIPKIKGSYKALKVRTFESDGLITGADYNPESRELVLCGYKQYIPYVILFRGVENLNLYNTPKSRTDFFNHFGLQVEGVTIKNSIIYLSAENSMETQAFFSFTPE